MRFNRKHVLPFLIALALLVLGGCSDDITQPALDTFDDEAKANSSATSVVLDDGVTWYEGLIGGTNVYAILVPDDWNGELVVYAHGFVDSGEPLVLPNKDNVVAMRDRVVDMGFAWAYCSYRENGLAVKDGAWATNLLPKLFVAAVKTEPNHTWLMAQSLGGLIGVELVETHPRDYDGILTMAGMIGGTKAELDYVAHVRVIFDLFYPGVLDGTVIDVPEDYDLMADIVYPVMGAVQADPTGFGILCMLKQTQLTGRTNEERMESLLTALGFNYRAIHDVLDRTNGACPVDNFDTVYEAVAPGLLSPEVLGMINAAVQRYDRERPADDLFDRHYEPSGELPVPMLALHNGYDPVVPLFHEGLYAAKVAAAGNSHLLEQRVVERYGHTNFTADEAAEGLMDLRAKVITSSSVAITN